MSFSSLVIQKHNNPCSWAAQHTAEVVTRSIRAYWKQRFVDPGFGVQVLQVALKIVPSTMERPGSQLLDVANGDVPELQIAHRKEAHHDVFLFAAPCVEKKSIGLRMAAIVHQEKLPIICRKLVANVRLEGCDPRVRGGTSRQGIGDLSHGHPGKTAFFAAELVTKSNAFNLSQSLADR
jgi:hypothetical protein